MRLLISEQNPVFIIMCLLLAFATLPAIAQSDSANTIQLDSPRTVQLSADSPVILIYEADKAGQVVNIITSTADDDSAPDTVIEVLRPNGQRLAYSDDVLNQSPDGETTLDRDATIENLILPEPGLYTIRIDSFNGVSEGDVEVLVTPGDLFMERVDESEDVVIINAILPVGLPYQIMLDVSAGDKLTITVHDVSGTLDPVVMLLDASGKRLAFNDDHESSDLTLNLFDARLSDVEVLSEGPMTIVVYDLLGRTGAFQLTIEHH